MKFHASRITHHEYSFTHDALLTYLMSEYIEIETEEGDTVNVLLLEVNLCLAVDGIEFYDSAESMAEGSALANALSVIPGIHTMTIDEHTIRIERDPFFEWYSITEDVRAVLVDFFL